MTKPQSLTATYSAESGGDSKMFRDIPDYQSASPEIRVELDKIIAKFNKHDPEAGLKFADDVLNLRNEVAEKIIEAQSADRFSFIRAPMQEAVGFLREGGFHNLLDKVSNVVSKGGAIARRNPLLLAGAAGLSLISMPVALVAGATAIGIKEKARQLKQRGEPKSVEELEAEIREGISGFAPMVRNLEMAKMQIPIVRTETNALGNANLKIVADLPLYISAGREILRQLQQEDIPQAEKEGNVDDVRAFSTNSQNLHQKLAILTMSRIGAIRDVTVLANLVQTFSDLEMTITSIVSHEANSHRANLALQGTGLEALRLGKLAEEFRQMTEGGAENAIAAANRARELAASTRVDSPERLRVLATQMGTMLNQLQEGMKAIPLRTAQQLQLQRQVEEAAGKVVDAQVNYARMVVANGQTSLPAPQTQSAPRLERG
jgi:hypothetical protein